MESIGPPWRLEPGRQPLGLARDSSFPGRVMHGGKNQVGTAARATAIAFVESGRCPRHGTRTDERKRGQSEDKGPWAWTQGRFIFGAGPAASCGSFRTESEGVVLALPGGRPHDFTATLPLATWPRRLLDTRRGPSSRAAGARPNRLAPRPAQQGSAG
jgi:hypothetical protein